MLYISPKTRQKHNKENRKSLSIKDFRFLFRDSGLSLCEAFSLPPQAIILSDQQNAVRLRLSRFLYAPPAYKSKLLTQMCHTKNASPKAMHFADFKVIRLGFEPKTHSLEGCCLVLSVGFL